MKSISKILKETKAQSQSQNINGNTPEILTSIPNHAIPKEVQAALKKEISFH